MVVLILNINIETIAYMESRSPEPKYRPFKDKQECWNEMLKHQYLGWLRDGNHYINIIDSFKSEAEVLRNLVDPYPKIVKTSIPFDYLFQSYVFVDGNPFGIKEE